MPRKTKQQKASAAIVQIVKRRKLTAESGLPDGWTMVDCTCDSADEFESEDEEGKEHVPSDLVLQLSQLETRWNESGQNFGHGTSRAQYFRRQKANSKLVRRGMGGSLMKTS
jgi:hypothetical protein